MGTYCPLNLLLVGCGNMGSALLTRWINSSLDINFAALEPSGLPSDLPADKITHGRSASDLSAFIKDADIIILAVKPQIMKAACTPLLPLISKDALILSIAAGFSITGLEDIFSENQPIIRTMPNTPAAIGKGATVGIANSAATEDQKAMTADLLNQTGLFQWVEHENLMNAVTALSGSGPAYIFHLIEVLSRAGTEIGLSSDIAEKLARQTVIGSAALAEEQPATPASTLRENVTSPGGTTAAALEVLMNGEIDEIYKKALSAAKTRGEELDN